MLIQKQHTINDLLFPRPKGNGIYVNKGAKTQVESKEDWLLNIQNDKGTGKKEWHDSVLKLKQKSSQEYQLHSEDWTDNDFEDFVVSIKKVVEEQKKKEEKPKNDPPKPPQPGKSTNAATLGHLLKQPGPHCHGAIHGGPVPVPIPHPGLPLSIMEGKPTVKIGGKPAATVFVSLHLVRYLRVYQGDLE